VHSDAERLRGAAGGRYRIAGALGQGPFSTAYHAIDASTGRAVAIKLFDFDPRAFPDAARHIADVLQRTAALEHPAIIAPGALELRDSAAFYVMPLMRGSVAELLRERGALSAARVEAIVHRVAAALDHAHTHGVVHRGLTPANILLDDGDEPFVADFGISDTLLAAGLATGARLARARAYAAPEQWRAQQADGHADQYALAAIAHELLTGRRRLDDLEIEGVQMLAPVEVLADVPIRKGIPLHVNAALRAALSALPANRYATTTDFADALAGRAPASAPGLPTVRGDLRLSRRWRGTKITGAVFLALTALTALDPGARAAAVRGWRTARSRISLPSARVQVSLAGADERVLPSSPSSANARSTSSNAGGAAAPNQNMRSSPSSSARSSGASASGSSDPGTSSSTTGTKGVTIQLRPSAPEFRAPARTGSGDAARSTAKATTFAAARSWASGLFARLTRGSSAATRSAYVRVTVDDGNAIVTVDGVPRGTAPSVISMSAGRHTVSVHGTASYTPASLEIVATAGDTTVASFTKATAPRSP
jgi:serine/threonine protein kinase